MTDTERDCPASGEVRATIATQARVHPTHDVTIEPSEAGAIEWLTERLDLIDEWRVAAGALNRHVEHCVICASIATQGCDTGLALLTTYRKAGRDVGVS